MANVTDGRDFVELMDPVRRHLATYPNDQWAREDIRQLAWAIDGTAQARPIKLQTWDKADPPDPRRWLVDDWLPAGRVTLLAGPGGIGKSRLALQLAAGIASGGGRPDKANHAGQASTWIETSSLETLRLGDAVEPGGSPTVYASWEDEPEEIWRRLWELSGSAAPWATPQRLSRLHIADMSGHGPLWGPRADRSGHTDTVGETPAAGHELRRHCERVGARLLIVDPSTAAYGSNENNRALVRAFVSDFDFWARVNDCAVLILSHPPKWGADYSGSTDWEASVRSLWTLRKERIGPDTRGKGKREPAHRPEGWQLARPKANYGGAVRPVQLDWDTNDRELRWKVIGEWPDGATQQASATTDGGGRYGDV